MKTKSAFFGWYAAWAAFVVAIFGWGIGFYGPPVFLHAVIERTEWSLALVSGAVTFHYLTGVLVVANSAAIYRRTGLSAATFFGALLLAVGILGWALAETPLQLFAAAALTGVGWVGMGAVAMNAIVSPWFERRRAAALSHAYNGSSLGGVIFSPLCVALISGLGFPLAALAIGTVMTVVIGLICRYVLIHTPESLGQAPDGDAPGDGVAEAARPSFPNLPGPALFREYAFWTLAIGMACALFAQIGVITHLFSVLAIPLGAQTASLLMGGATLCALAGRALTGFLMPPSANRRHVAAANNAMQIIGILCLIAAPDAGIALIVLGVALFGCGIGNSTSLPPLIAQQDFAKADHQRVISFIVAGAQTTYAFAPAVFGAIRAYAPGALRLPEGDTAPMFAAAALSLSIAIASLLAGRRRVPAALRTEI